MSRVRDALKRANEMNLPHQGALEERELAQPVAIDIEEQTPPIAIDVEGASRPNYPSILRLRWIRKLLRIAGVNTTRPVPRCQGLTRSGQSCRGPAMANGYCRLHGGSRRSATSEKARELMERVWPARQDTPLS